MSLSASALLPPGVFRNPRHLDRWLNNSGGANPLIWGTAAGTGSSSSATPADWARQDDIGVKDTTAFLANTYKTILDVPSGSGWFGGAIGPLIANSGDTIDTEITIDGVVYTISKAPGAVYRQYIGTLYWSSAFISSNAPGITAGGLDSGKTHMIAASANIMIPSVHTIRSYGGPVVRFETQLKVRMRVTTAQSTATAAECYSGVTYTRDT